MRGHRGRDSPHITLNLSSSSSSDFGTTIKLFGSLLKCSAPDSVLCRSVCVCCNMPSSKSSWLTLVVSAMGAEGGGGGGRQDGAELWMHSAWAQEVEEECGRMCAETAKIFVFLPVWICMFVSVLGVHVCVNALVSVWAGGLSSVYLLHALE